MYCLAHVSSLGTALPCFECPGTSVSPDCWAMVLGLHRTARRGLREDISCFKPSVQMPELRLEPKLHAGIFPLGHDVHFHMKPAEKLLSHSLFCQAPRWVCLQLVFLGAIWWWAGVRKPFRRVLFNAQVTRVQEWQHLLLERQLGLWLCQTPIRIDLWVWNRNRINFVPSANLNTYEGIQLYAS